MVFRQCNIVHCPVSFAGCLCRSSWLLPHWRLPPRAFGWVFYAYNSIWSQLGEVRARENKRSTRSATRITAGRRNKSNIRICCRAVRPLWHFSLFFPQHPCCSSLGPGRQHDSLTPAQRLSCTSFETNPAQIHNSFPHLKWQRSRLSLPLPWSS